MTSNKKDILDLLRKGKKRIEQGWIQGEYARKIGNKTHYCALGALGYQENPNDPIVDGARLALEAVLPKNYQRVYQYNDVRNRKAETMVKLFDKAIESL